MIIPIGDKNSNNSTGCPGRQVSSPIRPVLNSAPKLARQSPRTQVRGGKSGLHRAECRLMAGHREVMNSATENKLPMAGLRRPKGRQSLSNRGGAKAAILVENGTGEGETAG